MCDDFFDDMDGMDDSFGDPSDDFQEDLFDEHDDGINGLTDADPNSMIPDNEESGKINIDDAVIMGGMIAGSAYSEAMDRKDRERLIKQVREKNRSRK